MFFKVNLIALVLIITTACGLATTRPKLELSLAISAFNSAKESNAQVKAPHLYRKAEIYLLKGRSSYKRKYFNKAEQYLVLSRKFSEKAEMVSKTNTAN